jgi:hypothetical protein
MRPALLLSLLLALASCTPEPEGPVAPIALEQFVAGAAYDASAARQAVVDFVDAYAASPTEGPGALAGLVAGDELASWVRWLDVQHREFPGSIHAVADVRDVEFVVTAQARRTKAAQVALSASVTFRFAPDGDQPFERSRILDGPVTLVQGDDGTFRVLDLQRDGVPMSDGIQVFEAESRARDGVEVVLDSLFMFRPNWQFNVIVRNVGDAPVVLDRQTVGLYVEDADGFERVEGAVTDSLAVIPPGAEVPGILAYPLQDSARGRVLALSFTRGRDVLRFDFPLQDLVTVVPPPPPSAEPPAADVTT